MIEYTRPPFVVTPFLTNCVPLPPGTKPPLATGSGGGACYRAVGQEEWDRIQAQKGEELVARLRDGYNGGQFSV